MRPRRDAAPRARTPGIHQRAVPTIAAAPSLESMPCVPPTLRDRRPSRHSAVHLCPRNGGKATWATCPTLAQSDASIGPQCPPAPEPLSPRRRFDLCSCVQCTHISVRCTHPVNGGVARGRLPAPHPPAPTITSLFRHTLKLNPSSTNRSQSARTPAGEKQRDKDNDHGDSDLRRSRRDRR